MALTLYLFGCLLWLGTSNLEASSIRETREGSLGHGFLIFISSASVESFQFVLVSTVLPHAQSLHAPVGLECIHISNAEILVRDAFCWTSRYGYVRKHLLKYLP